MSPLWQYVGLLLRTLILYIGVFGITSFICGAAGLTVSDYWQATVVSPGRIALLCIPVALAAAAASLSKISAAVTPFAYAGIYMGICAVAFGNPVDFTIKSALRIYNYALYTVSSKGYYSLGNFMISDGYDYTTAGMETSDPYRFGGTFLLATLIGFILYFCIQRKTRLLPIVVLMTTVFAPILTYNIAVGNSGIAFMLVFICSALGLKVYDFRYCGKADKITERKAAREERKKARKEKADKKRAARKALRDEADRVFDKAIDADVPLKKARQARRAVFKSHKKSKKAERKAKKIRLALDKKEAKKAKREKSALLKDLKKQLSKAPKGSSARESILERIKAENAVSDAKKEQNKAEKAARRLKKKEADKKYRKSSMAGGYAGLGIALVAFLAVWLPLALVDQPFTVIKPINSRVQTARAYVTAYLRGSDVDLNDPYVYGIYPLAPRQLSFEPLELDEEKMFTVDAEGTSNVYLRSWMATDFDWENSQWISATYDEVHKYREKFGTDFTPDSIKTDFYKYVYPSSAVIDDTSTYKNFTKYGFTVQQIDVWRVRGQSLLLFVPSHMNTEQGILDYKTIEPSSYKYQNYFEGTYSSFYSRYGRGYSTVSYITAYNRRDTQKSITDSVLYYNICRSMLKDADASALSDEDIYFLITSAEEQFAEKGLEYQGTSLVDRFFNEMTPEERAALQNSFKTEELYRKNYVEKQYLKTAGIEAVTAIADQIEATAIAKELENGGDGVLTEHEAALAVVDYFRNGDFTYTKTPNGEGVSDSTPVIEAFLTEVKEGYCVHFASSAVYLLREMGIPCRYVEGYVATDLESLGGNKAKNRADVYGTDAHAWIEVYVEGLGWMQYEVTPGQLCEDMYDPNSNTIDPELDDPSYEDDKDNTPKPPVGGTNNNDTNIELPPPDEQVSELEWFMRIVFIALGVFAFAALVWLAIRLIRKRAVAVMDERYKVIDTAKNRDLCLDPETDTRALARSINDWILEVYSTIGCQPQVGELPSEFALRMHEDYGDLSTVDVRDVVEAMQKEEFGHGLSYDELSACATYLDDIITSVYAGMNIWQKIVTRYIKRKI